MHTYTDCQLLVRIWQMRMIRVTVWGQRPPTSFRDQIAHFIFHCHRSKVSPARQPDFREPNVLHRKLIGLVYAWCSLLSSESNHHCHTSIYRGQTATDSGIQLVVTGNWASQIDIFTSVGAVQRTRERERKKGSSLLSVNLSCPYVQTSEIMLVITFFTGS